MSSLRNKTLSGLVWTVLDTFVLRGMSFLSTVILARWLGPEEFGLIGTLSVVMLFALLLWRGARAAVKAPDRFGMLLGIGLITGIIVQALFNISVVVSLLPAKGIPLPFISYGGSSVLVSLAAVGLLLSISRVGGGDIPEATPRERKPARRRKAKTGLR